MANRGIRPSTTQGTVALAAKSLLNAALFFCIFMLALPAAANWLLPAPLPLPSWVRKAGSVVLFVSGLAVWAVCLDVFSRIGRGTPFPLDAPRHLVTTGPFALCRNPIMAGELAVIWAEALYVSTWGVVAYAALASLAGHLAVVYIEEPELRDRFGPEYAAYCADVPRWLPRCRRAPQR
jgi:protein-S-isoprenylcysteine O-methyltransferase Ste14